MNDSTSQLHSYVQQHMQAGTAVEDIRAPLLEAGWDPKIVDEVLQQYIAPEEEAMPGSPNLQQPEVSAKQSTMGSQTPEGDQTQQVSIYPISLPLPTKKYKVFTSVADTIKAIRRNIRAYVITTIGTFVGAVVLLGLVVTLASLVIYKDVNTLTSIGALLFLAVIVLLFGSLINSLVQIVASLCVRDGAENRQSSIRQVFTTGVEKLPRIFLVNVMVGLVIMGPSILVGGIGLIMALSAIGNNESAPGSLMFIMLLFFISSIWIIIAALRYSLAPIVAIFESDIPIFKTLSRSFHLVLQGGQWFIFKGVLLILFVAVILGTITGQTVDDLQSSSDILSNIVFLLMEIIITGSLVMLYRNRKAVRG